MRFVFSYKFPTFSFCKFNNIVYLERNKHVNIIVFVRCKHNIKHE